jgi:glycosyltransferase involved in cell wall biosynthesis
VTVEVRGGAGLPLGTRRAGAHLRVVVVVPCLDDAGFLAACLDALAHQTRRPDEVVVVDNGSTDGSQEVARRAGVTLAHEKRRGIWPAAARGYDIAARTADVIARVDADSVPPLDWVERVAAAFEHDSGLEALTGGASFYGGNAFMHYAGEHWYIGGMYRVLTPAFGHPPVFGSNFAMRTSLWRRTRRLVLRRDPTVHDDLDLSIRFPAGTHVEYDPTLVMPVSARPFATPGALASRVAKAFVTFRRSWPAAAPWVKRGWGSRTTSRTRLRVRVRS